MTDFADEAEVGKFSRAMASDYPKELRSSAERPYSIRVPLKGNAASMVRLRIRFESEWAFLSEMLPAMRDHWLQWSAPTLLLILLPYSTADIADFGTIPKGENPTLYDAATDPILQLDESTFNDTVFCIGRNECTAFLVEFYSDWCGHCRAYAPLFKNIARDVRAWDEVVRIAAMNCADPMNENTCRANGVMYFPFIKYYPRNSTSVEDGVKLKTYQSVHLMRDQLTQAVATDNEMGNFTDWPDFHPLPNLDTYGELWADVDPNVTELAVVFEDDEKSLVGSQLLLDLHHYRHRLAARRCLKGHTLTEAFHITDFPTVAILKRGVKEPLMIAELRRLLLSELENHLRLESDLSNLTFSSLKHQNETDESSGNSTDSVDCEKEPQKCREMFYASESDMLKAIRYAIYREVSRNGGSLEGQNLTSLHTFMQLLADHFPYSTVDLASNGTEYFLNASSRARVVFTHMRDFLEKHGFDTALPVDDWKQEFAKAEEDQGRPFPITDDWQHCRGSTPQFRGYTCGLWTTFHAITVRSFRNSVNNPNFRPSWPLLAIQGWVSSFFGCEHCRQHFMKMTTKTINIEDNVHRPEDVFMYLWKAHNIVNARLKGRETEDPHFPKLQFPSNFLCAECKVGVDAERSDADVEDFLLQHYSNIRPLIPNNDETLTPSTLPTTHTISPPSSRLPILVGKGIAK